MDVLLASLIRAINVGEGGYAEGEIGRKKLHIPPEICSFIALIIAGDLDYGNKIFDISLESSVRIKSTALSICVRG